MTGHEVIFTEKEHQVAYVFEPGGDEIRTPKRRKVSKRQSRAARVSDATAADHDRLSASTFVPLLAGREAERHRLLRQQLFARSWSSIHSDINRILRQANQSTLDHVTAFVRAEACAEPNPASVISAAFILTGPNIASQHLLFDQLDETLNTEPGSKAVRLRSTDAPNLKATLKKIVRDATSQSSNLGDNGGEGEPGISVAQDGRRYLDYDLDAFYSYAKAHSIRQLTVALQDSEAFDATLVSDLVVLFKSWIGRLNIVLIFGVATSIDLFQARLSRTTCQFLSGEQFDVAQSSHVLNHVFKVAIASAAVPLRLGPGLLKSMVDRQHDNVAGIHVFASSVKCAYMCHFYANPLSILLADPGELGAEDLQPEHLEAIRQLPSYRRYVEKLVASGQLSTARALLTNDTELASHAMEHMLRAKQWAVQATRSLALLTACSFRSQDFITDYLEALSEGFIMKEDSEYADSIRRMTADEVSVLLGKAVKTLEEGDDVLGLSGWAHETPELLSTLKDLLQDMEVLQGQSRLGGVPLRSKYSAQSRVLRTTVIAQKVQLSQDVSTLTAQDKAFSQLVEQLADILVAAISCRPPGQMFLSEAWLFDSESPYRSIFIPRPGPAMERALARPQDCLSCSCCSTGTGRLNMATAPSTSVLYHLYLDAGPLINVADLWTAFYGLVGYGREDEDEVGDKGFDERGALALFYRGLAELRVMGFVKPTKKKADHIFKLKHLS